MRILISVLLWWFLALPGLAGITLVDEPDWLTPVTVPDLDPALLQYTTGGIAVLLVDAEFNWQGEERQAYNRIVMQVQTRAGLEEAATLLRNYDPAYETIALARLQVRRGDVLIDWKQRVQPEEYRRENRLEDGIIDGSLTVHAQIPDVQVGDIVDMAVVVTRRPVISGATFSATQSLGFSVPVGLTRLVLNWPAARPIRLDLTQPEALVYSEATEAGVRRMIWEMHATAPMPDEDQVPQGYEHYPTVSFGAHFTWQPIVAGLRAAYLGEEPLPADWEARVEGIRQAEPDDGARAIAALRLVQEEIRYVGVEIGPGGYFARRPAEVIATGFGDCKDKALLLKTMLGRLGMEATVALASTYEGHALGRQLPRLGAFDHMITGVLLGGNWVWMDPTLSHQGGTLRSAAQPDYGFVLPLWAHRPAGLVEIAQSSANERRILVLETHSFTPEGVNVAVRSSFFGAAADAVRTVWATYSMQEMRADYLNYYTQAYPGIEEAEPPRMRDDNQANYVEVTEHYWLAQEALEETGLIEDYPFMAGDFGGYFPRNVAARRRLPLAAQYPVSRMQVTFVENAPIEFAPPDAVTIENPAFVFSRESAAVNPGTLRITWRYNSRAREVVPQEAGKVLRDARKIADHAWLSWDLTARPTGADTSAQP